VKYLLVVNTNEPETVWNSLRLGSAALGRDHDVNLFLLGPGVEIESLGNEQFDVQDQLSRFVESGGTAHSCGTCLRSRHMGAAAECPISTMSDLVRLSEEADKVMVFG
jgi:uncharacterized protein involved in oxidation of intracellular sulfur